MNTIPKNTDFLKMPEEIKEDDNFWVFLQAR
jgi:hypothetical protein